MSLKDICEKLKVKKLYAFGSVVSDFQNFSKSMEHLENALQISNPDIVQKAGIIHFF